MIFAVWGEGNGARDVWDRLRTDLGRPRAFGALEGGFLGAWGHGCLEGTRAWLGHVEDSSAPLEHLRGTYALVEAAPRGFFLASGALGGRPLFWARSRGVHLACTSLEKLVAALTALGERPAVNATGLARSVVFLGAPERVPYVGVERVRTLRILQVGPGFRTERMRHTPAWSDHPLEATEAATRLFDAVGASVARAVGDRQRVAVMAGGGVDSSALLAATLAQARGATPKEITALTWDFGGDGDDRPYMRDLENALGIVPIRVSPAGATPSFARSLVVEGAPYTLLCGAMELQTFALAKERGCEMVLTGIGGDEVLAGAVQAAVLGGAVTGRGLRRLGAIPGAVRRAVTLDVSTARTPLRRIGDFLVRPLLRPLASRRLRTRNFVRRMRSTTPWLGPLGDAALEAAARETTAETRVPADARSRYLHFADRTLFEEYMDLRALLEEESGLPRADVYLDDALVELVARIPPEHLVFGGRHRGLFREGLRGHVPESIRLRKSKASFDDAIQGYAASLEARTLVRSLGTGAVAADLGIADRRLLAEAATRIASERDPAAYGLGLSYLWSTLAAEAFLREQRP